MVQRLAPTDAVSLRREGRFEVASVIGIGYDGITINIHNKTGKHAPRGDLGTPLADDPHVREALELAIDRDIFNQVVWEGQYTPGCTPLPPVSPSSPTRAGSARPGTWPGPRSSSPRAGGRQATPSS